MKNYLVFVLGLVIGLCAVAADKVPESILAKHKAMFADDCQLDVPYVGETYKLSDKYSLHIVTCYMGAYQGSSKVYTSYADGTGINLVTVLAYDESTQGIVGTNDLGEPSYDETTKTLTTFAKARGLGDCGQSSKSEVKLGSYGGVTVKTIEISAKMQCDGEYNDWPVVFKQ